MKASRGLLSGQQHIFRDRLCGLSFPAWLHANSDLSLVKAKGEHDVPIVRFDFVRAHILRIILMYHKCLLTQNFPEDASNDCETCLAPIPTDAEK